jgi:hypothetical protein
MVEAKYKKSSCTYFDDINFNRLLKSRRAHSVSHSQDSLHHTHYPEVSIMHYIVPSLLAIVTAVSALGSAIVLNNSTSTIYTWSVGGSVGERQTVVSGPHLFLSSFLQVTDISQAAYTWSLFVATQDPEASPSNLQKDRMGSTTESLSKCFLTTSTDRKSIMTSAQCLVRHSLDIAWK